MSKFIVFIYDTDLEPELDVEFPARDRGEEKSLDEMLRVANDWNEQMIPADFTVRIFSEDGIELELFTILEMYQAFLKGG